MDGSPLIYDESGNLIEDATRRYEYNYRNLLTRVVEKGQGGAPDTEIATYGYDALGRRVWKRVPDPAGGPATFARYVYEGVKLGAELNAAGAVLREYVYGEGLDDPIAMVVPGGNVGRGRRIYYYHTDALGSVVALTNGQGGVEERYRYDAYGVAEIEDAGGALQDGSEVGNPFQYTGQFFDKETGFYYYKARYYHPTLGRFLQRDPLGYVDGYNLYAYVNNNPLNWVDPLGLNRKEEGGNVDAGDPVRIFLPGSAKLDEYAKKNGLLIYDFEKIGDEIWESRDNGSNGEKTTLRILLPGDRGYQYITSSGYRINIPVGDVRSIQEIHYGLIPGRPTIMVTGGKNQIYIIDSTPGWVGATGEAVAMGAVTAGAGYAAVAYGPALMSTAYSWYAAGMTAAASPGGQQVLKSSYDFVSNFIEGADPTLPSTPAGVAGYIFGEAHRYYQWEHR